MHSPKNLSLCFLKLSPFYSKPKYSQPRSNYRSPDSSRNSSSGLFMEQVTLSQKLPLLPFAGSTVARRLGTGFLAVRKAGHLCVDTNTVCYTDYQKREKFIEVRKYPFPPGNVQEQRPQGRAAEIYLMGLQVPLSYCVLTSYVITSMEKASCPQQVCSLLSTKCRELFQRASQGCVCFSQSRVFSHESSAS